jgi:RNA polymerase sigma factor (sigma-70 family)
MSTAQPGAALRALGALVSAEAARGLSDAQLLERFAAGREEAAFAALLERHGRLVWGVCRHLLRHEQDAEDAFQATFLVLVRRAASVRNRESVGSFLYGVARRVAAKAHRSARKRRDRERRAAARPPASVPADLAWRELQAILDEEVGRLPQKYRAPFVLCCLEGKPREEAARELGCAGGTLSSRVARARRLLQQRLARRGVSLSAALCAGALWGATAAAAVPAALGPRTLAAIVGGSVPAPALALAEAVMKTVWLSRRMVAVLFLGLGLLAAGAGLWGSAPPATVALAPAPAGGKAPGRADPDTAGADLTGVVTDEEGRPVAGARVWLREGDARDRLRSAATDPRGEFQFRGVPAGYLTLAAGAKGRSFAALQYSLQPGQEAARVTLVLAPPEELRLEVKGEDGRPVPGALLSSLSWKAARSDWCWLPPAVFRDAGLAEPVADREGRLTVPALPRGVVCRGQVAHPDFARLSFEGVRPGDRPATLRMEKGWPLTVEAVGPDGKPARGATVTLTGFPDTINLYDEPVGPDGKLTVRLGDARDVQIHVHHPELISPQWYTFREWGPGSETLRAELRRRAKVHGRVVDEKTGKPVAGVSVGLNAAGVRQIITVVPSDDKGRYEIEGPEGGATVQVLSGKGYWAEQNRSVAVTLAPGEPVRADDLVVRKLPAARGTVVLPDGRPAARALLVNLASFGRDTALADEAGKFELPQERHEPFLVVSASAVAERLSGAAGALFEDLEAGKELHVQLQPESELRGTVVGPDGKPRPGVKVSLRIETRHANWSNYTFDGECRTDARGRYRFPGLNRAFRYQATLATRLDDRTASSSPWIAPAEKTVELNPLLAPEGTGTGADREAPAAPELHCQGWLNTPPLDLGALRGKVVLLDFWATWCGPCVAELPQVQKAHEVFAGKGLVVVGIHHNSVPIDRVKEFARKKGLTFAIGLDDARGGTCGAYAVHAFPTKVLIGRDGKVLSSGLHGDLLGAVRRAVLYGGDD